MRVNSILMVRGKHWQAHKLYHRRGGEQGVMKKWMYAIFMIAEFIMYVFILQLYQAGNPASALRYMTTILCAVIAMAQALTDHRASVILLSLAMWMTVGADFCFVLTSNYLEIGIMFFAAVQLFYGFRIGVMRGEAGDFSIWSVILRIVCVTAVCAVFYLSGHMHMLYMWGAAYIMLMIFNVVESTSLFRKTVSGTFFCIALIMYAISDITVGMLFLSDYLPPALTNFTNFLTWILYVPAQVIIVMSGMKKKTGVVPVMQTASIDTDEGSFD